MFACFIGGPCSGKTTTAALSFAQFKELGFPTDWIPEQARSEIARLRASSKRTGVQYELTDEIQLKIMLNQFRLEQDMYESTENLVFLLADGSVLNSLLYLSAETRESGEVQQLITAAVSRYDVIFYCAPIGEYSVLDPNRPHSYKESLKLDADLHSLVLENTDLALKEPVQVLTGPAAHRAGAVRSYLLQKTRLQGRL